MLKQYQYFFAILFPLFHIFVIMCKVFRHRFLLPFFLISVPVFAQMRPAEEPTRPSTDAWEQIRYGEVAPALYTGAINVSIPLYTCEDPDFTLPIRLNYTSDGCRPNERCGITGHGWTLDCGGVITREVRGLADDSDPLYGTRGYHATFQLESIVNPHYFYLNPSQLRPVQLNNSETTPAYSGIVFSNNGDLYSTDLYDAEPDIFHFSIPGHHGTFHLGPNGKIFVYDTDGSPSDYKVEIDMLSSVAAIWDAGGGFEALRYESCFRQISITTPDGYVYRFNGYTNTPGMGSDNDGSNLDMVRDASVLISPFTIVAWHLSRITAPNGRTVSFSYSRNDNKLGIRPSCFRNVESCNDLNYHGFPSYTLDYANTMYYNAIPSGVQFDGGCSVGFHYEQTHNETVNAAQNPCTLLDSLSITYGKTELKTISLQYSTTGPYLQHLTVSGEGQFSMTYSSLSYPSIGTKAVDHWGYYNGLQPTDFLSVSQTDTSAYQEHLIPNNPRAPVFSCAQNGILTQITYPTGGYSTFSYEPRAYSKAHKRAWNGAVFMTESGVCGGVRIQGIAHYDRDGSLLSSKSYSYIKEDGSTSSGILTFYPRYKVTYSAVMYIEYIQHLLDNDLLVTKTVSMSGFLQSNNLTSYSTTPIEYGRVVETDMEGGKTVFFFSNSEDAERRDWFKCSSDSTVIYDFNVVSPGEDLVKTENLVMPYNSLHALRGKLIRREIYSKGNNGEILESEAIDYSQSHRYDTVMTRLIHASSSAAVFVGMDTLKQQISTRYAGGLPVIQKGTIYTYNPHGQIASQGIEGSDGAALRTEYTYITDQARNEVEEAMLAANCISIPWRERVFQGDSLIAETVRSFYRPDPSGHPALFRVASSVVKDVLSGATFTPTYTHDLIGRLVQVTAPDGRSTVQLWGHGGLYPVSRIDGATLSQVRTAASDPTLGVNPFSAKIPEATVAALRSGLSGEVELSVYHWNPFVGLSGVTGPDGRRTDYHYNYSGKLKTIRNDNGDLVTEYLYSTDNRLD